MKSLQHQQEIQKLNEQRLKAELDAQKQIQKIEEVAKMNLNTQNQPAMVQSAYVETLSNLFPTADIRETHSQAHSCDKDHPL